MGPGEVTPLPPLTPTILNVQTVRIFKLLRSKRIDSKELIPPAYVALRAGVRQPFSTRFLAPIDC